MKLRRKKNIWVAVSILASVIVIAGVTLPALSPGSNCGGNSAALYVCGDFALMAQIEAFDNNGRFNIEMFKDNYVAHLERLANYHWIPSARILLKRGDIGIEDYPKQIIAVCNTAYGNIPQPAIWNGYKKTPAHAVGYSDGSRGLISPAEFVALDLSGFVDARELISPETQAAPDLTNK